MTAKWISPGVGAILLVAMLVIAPQDALAGWRAAFVAGSAIPAGATLLLLIARLTGADWNAALLPLTRVLPFLPIALIGLVVQQALFVSTPAHLALWLSWPMFASRGLIAIGLWWGLARALRRGSLSTAGAGLGLLAHGIVVTLIATDWLLGAAPGQPNSAAGMMLAVIQILGGCATACLLGLGASKTRRDLSFLLIAACLGLAYLMFMDFLIVWYGDLPRRVGWYAARMAMPWVLLAPFALIVGLFGPIAAMVSRPDDRGRAFAGGTALAGLALSLIWEEAVSGFAVAITAALAGLALTAGILPRRATP